MMKKHKKELFICGIITIGIVLGLLGLVWLFEKLEIHVPGSREMWIGLIGAVLGGAFTMFGVLITLYKQEELDEEKKRLENMPLLGFELYYDNAEPEVKLAYLNGELATSYFLFLETKKFATIKIRVINDACAFNCTIAGCAINGRVIPTGEFFAPIVMRLVADENMTLAFDCSNITSNIFCVIRFMYEDIFGHKYYQELPFEYVEVSMSYGEKKTKQVIEIRDIKPPVLVNGEIRPMEESIKEYADYEAFCKK